MFNRRNILIYLFAVVFVVSCFVFKNTDVMISKSNYLLITMETRSEPTGPISHLNVIDLNKPLGSTDMSLYDSIECVDSAKIFVSTKICLHPKMKNNEYELVIVLLLIHDIINNLKVFTYF